MSVRVNWVAGFQIVQLIEGEILTFCIATILEAS